MTDDTISPLRRRMIEDMTVRGFTACTQRGYIAAVRRFTVFLGRSPDQATAEDLRRFQLQMRVEGASATTYGLFANGRRAENLARARELLGVHAQQDGPGDADASSDQPPMHSFPCPCCGGRMIIIETFERGSTPTTRPSGPIRIDTS
jgi:hypothetical protein